MVHRLPLAPCICRLHSGMRSTFSSAGMVLVLPLHPCMTAHTGLFNVPTHIFAWLSVTGRTLFQYQDSSLCLLMFLWCLLCLASSLLWSLLLLHVVKAAPPRLKPPPEPPIVPSRRGRPKKDTPHAPSPTQLRRGRSRPCSSRPAGSGGAM